MRGMSGATGWGGRWDDLDGSIVRATVGGSVLTQEAYRDTKQFMTFAKHNTDPVWSMVFQIPHKWLVGSSVKLHMHYLPCAGAGDNGHIDIGLQYVWVATNAEVPALVGWTVPATIQIPVVGATDRYINKIASLVTIAPPAAALGSSLIYVNFQRMTATDTYTGNKDHGTAAANVGLSYIDMHYQSRDAGSVAEIPTS